MNTTVRNILAVVAGLLVGSAVNMGLVTLSGNIIPPPAGADVTTVDGLKASMHLFEPRHFVFPFLAHALGTFVGALVAVLIAETRRYLVAMIIGVFFLLGGITNAMMLPAPPWFMTLDLVVAYLPMAWLAARLVAGNRRHVAAL
ncbi:hypothetical protein F3N42_14840 [Marinihelvus fidelis]|uniref:Uncharacterized protein n=1 Tax=Marinihelvus fidelis TaxID=2613842 RepID=A0A5N0T4B3_9GAMM|nr:hypothetical protein [Marinihelvus fidelis]KAA9129638.1 hypothetical protein F3N42_14840 [Marinihelvus fidelis]